MGVRRSEAATVPRTLPEVVNPTVAFNVRMSGIHANWYELLPKVEAAMAHEDRIASIRMDAGWDGDEGGWYSPDGIPQWDWECEGYPLPEDEGYADFISTYIPTRKD